MAFWYVSFYVSATRFTSSNANLGWAILTASTGVYFLLALNDCPGRSSDSVRLGEAFEQF